MDKLKLIFPLREQKFRIHISFKGLFDELCICSAGTATLYYQGNSYVVSKRVVHTSLENFGLCLQRALDNKLELSESFADLGFLSNESNRYDYLEDSAEEDAFTKLYFVKSEDLYKHNFWSTRYFNSWLYTRNQHIFLELTPKYPWIFDKPKKNENFISYQAFIQSYQPIFTIEIPRHVAQEWVHTIQQLTTKMIDNFNSWQTQEEDLC